MKRLLRVLDSLVCLMFVGHFIMWAGASAEFWVVDPVKFYQGAFGSMFGAAWFFRSAMEPDA